MKNKILEGVKTYAKRVTNIVTLFVISYTLVAVLYTTAQITSGKFNLEGFGLRLQVTNAMVSPIVK